MAAERTVLVAGGTGALGRAVCLAFLEEGARVLAVSRSPEGADALARAAGQAATRLGFVQADLSDPAQAERAVASAAGGDRLLHVVVNAVGAWAGGAPLDAEPPDTLARMLEANLAPLHALARAAVPALVRSGGGALVQVASRAAVGAQPGQASYAASKAASLALVLALAEELRESRVRVNAVLPGTIDTEANRRAMPRADRARWVRPEDVARVVLYLCSDAAAAVTGAAIPVGW